VLLFLARYKYNKKRLLSQCRMTCQYNFFVIAS
jgi:hypothetical protein